VKELLQAVPEKYRGLFYALFGVVGVALGATAVGFAAAGAALPVWFQVASAVYAFLGGPAALTARANLPSQRPSVAPLAALQPCCGPDCHC
jgi:hypothetical protein